MQDYAGVNRLRACSLSASFVLALATSCSDDPAAELKNDGPARPKDDGGGPGDDDDDDGGTSSTPPGTEDTSKQTTFLSTMGGAEPDTLYGSTELLDKTVAYVGFRQSAGDVNKDAIVTVVDASGKGQSTVLGGSGNDQFFGVAPLPNGEMIASGLTRSFPTLGARKDDGLLVRFTAARGVAWAKYVGSVDDELLFGMPRAVSRRASEAGAATASSRSSTPRGRSHGSRRLAAPAERRFARSRSAPVVVTTTALAATPVCSKAP